MAMLSLADPSKKDAGSKVLTERLSWAKVTSVSVFPFILPKNQREGIAFLFRMKMMIFKEFGTMLKVTQLAGVVLGLELSPALSGCCPHPLRAGGQ